MKDINELIIQETNTCYQLLDIQKKLNGIINDPERFKLRVKAQKKLIKLKQVQSEVLENFNDIMK